MNGDDIITYLESHGLDLLIDYYDISEEEAEETDAYDRYTEDPEFRKYVEESLSQAYWGREAKEDSLREETGIL